MKKTILTLASCVLALGLQAQSYFIAGDFNAWNAAGNAMTETSLGSGIWQVTISGLAANARQEFKVTDGTWGWSTPGPNSWLYSDGSGNVTLTYDTTTSGDGYSPASGRVGVSVDLGTWTAVGDWQGWNNANGATAMSSLGGGVYQLSYLIASAGSYQYKAVNTGSWDAIGSDTRNVNAGTLGFTTTSANQTVNFYVNALNGSVKLDVVPVPEPSTLALAGLSGLASLFLFRRRR